MGDAAAAGVGGRLKIALHVDGPRIRGNEQQLLALAAGLRERGHEVIASCRAGGPVNAGFRAIGVATTGVRPRGDVDVVSALRFAAWLRRERPDAVLLTSWVRAFTSGWAAHIARVPRIVFRIGGLQPIAHPSRGRLERYALSHWYHAIIANSRMVAEQVSGAVPSADVHVVPNGVAAPGAVTPASLRRDAAIPDDAVVAVAVGGFEPNKGFDVLVEATAAVEGLHVVLVGSGTSQQQEALTRLIASRGLEQRVHMPGRRTDIAEVLAACDLFVLPSRSEGFSVARLEAMAAGLPVIASDVGGSFEAHDPRDGRGPGGYVVPAGDATALAAVLRHVAEGVAARDESVATVAAEGQWRARNWFAMESMIDGYENILMRVT